MKNDAGGFGLLQINKLRSHVGLPDVRRGERKCLTCDSKFYSRDLRNMKMCDACRARNWE